MNGDYLVTPKNTLSSRVYLTTIDQYRTFGSPQGYPGAPILPGQGAAQALHAHDDVASLSLTSAITKNLANEARMSFTRSTQDAHGVGTPSATSLGMTPADRFFDQSPEITVLGPLGSFRLFGNFGNDFANENKYYSWTDNLSWVHGRHKTRAGAFFLTQYNWRDDLGNSRGKLFFQTFSDFLLGLSAADNLSPFGRSNIQSIQANEGAGPQGELQYHYRSYYGAGFIQDDVKVSSRLTLNLGLRWEYVGPALDTTGAIGNAWPSLLQQVPIPPASGTLIGNTVAANYNPNLINPYTGQPFGAPPTGVLVRSTNSFYQNSTPLDTFAPRFGFAWQPLGTDGRVAMRGGYGWFYQPPTYSGNAAGAPLFTAAPFAQGFTNADSSNNLSSLRSALPRHHARLCAAHTHLAAIRPGRRPGVHRSPDVSMEPERPVPLVSNSLVRHRLRRLGGEESADCARPESAAPGQSRQSGRTASQPTRRRMRTCGCPSWAKPRPR